MATNTGTIAFNITAGGVSISGGLVSKSGEGVIGVKAPLPAGTAGSLTTRTDDDTGIVTASGHGLEQADKVDLYWDGGLAYGFGVTAVNGDAVTIDVPVGGDVLPAQDTAVVITERVSIDEQFDGDDLKLLGASCGQRAHIDFTSSVPGSLHAQELVAANDAWAWWSDNGFVNPLAGDDVATIQASNGTTTAATLKIPGIKKSVA